MRIVLATAPAALAAAAPAGAATRLTPGEGRLHGLAADARGRALAVVDSGLRAAPFRLVRSSGGRGRSIGLFGGHDAEFPDVAAGGGAAFVSWSRPVSGGSELLTARVLRGRLGADEPAGMATGPARLASYGGAALLAFPDKAGDVALHPPSRGGADGAYDVPRRSRLTRDAPATRHHPLDVAVTPHGPLVLDLAQRRRRSSLIVLGRRAPSGPVVGVAALRHLQAAMDASRELVAVAYLSRGRPVLATARPGGRWRRRRLPGGGRALDTPVPVVDGGRVSVVYAQGAPGDRDVLVATVSGGRLRLRRITSGSADDRAPQAALGRRGRLYVGWTRRARGSSRHAAMLRRLR